MESKYNAVLIILLLMIILLRCCCCLLLFVLVMIMLLYDVARKSRVDCVCGVWLLIGLEGARSERGGKLFTIPSIVPLSAWTR